MYITPQWKYFFTYPFLGGLGTECRVSHDAVCLEQGGFRASQLGSAGAWDLLINNPERLMYVEEDRWHFLWSVLCCSDAAWAVWKDIFMADFMRLRGSLYPTLLQFSSGSFRSLHFELTVWWEFKKMTKDRINLASWCYCCISSKISSDHIHNILIFLLGRLTVVPYQSFTKKVCSSVILHNQCWPQPHHCFGWKSSCSQCSTEEPTWRSPFNVNHSTLGDKIYYCKSTRFLLQPCFVVLQQLLRHLLNGKFHSGQIYLKPFHRLGSLGFRS